MQINKGTQVKRHKGTKIGGFRSIWDIGILVVFSRILPLRNWNIGISMRNLGYWDIGHGEIGILVL